jgi:hypothetical protein
MTEPTPVSQALRDAAKAELKEWKRLSHENRCMLLAFLVCVDERLNGRDPALLLPKG